MTRKDRNEKKRTEAEIRQVNYDKLSLDAKIKRVKSRPGESKKELSRLMKLKKETKK